ncbi:CDP-diacylglycerol--inositol 3-phosphatidyltransferase [bacterium BMS3Bbin05]|nr:CDP-diacylglycerol--inositol 3-phosphatidyltransferase [bacterium BMS3Bbin05]HDL20147.1 CDP-alcohol phosphatidyltransferase family protein [Nitrospirota bacterium]HDO21553.1 CDP-alcohol phosphatidyltransferase family protein [Nitrospirota bacterium]
MISSRWGYILDKPLASIARRIKVSPNLLSASGFVITVAAASLIPYSLVAGGILVTIGGCFDVLDGVVARVNGKTSKFGAFLDSVLDRFSDAFIFFAIALYFHMAEDDLNALAAIFGLFGAFGVSYARAKAEGLGYECRVGLMERPERIILLASGCIINILLVPALWIVMFGSYITIVQRILHVRKSVAGSA